MYKNIIKIILSGILLSFFTTILFARPRVLEYPKVLVTNDEIIRVKWDDGLGSSLPVSNTCKIVYGISPSNYYAQILEDVPGGYVDFIPNDEGMTGGVYYCRISNTVTGELSQEFKLYIESKNAPQFISPANGEVLTDLSPLLKWQPVAGSPFYTVMVFDTKAEFNIGEGSMTITANVIWASTVNDTQIEYPQPDPSGYYDKLSAPSLVQGITYSWVVLNNYSGSPSMISSAFAGTRYFTVDAPSSCSSFNLISPPAGVTITSSDIILSWTPSTGANNYMVTVLKKETGSENVFGSATVPIWNVYTTNTQINIPANIALNTSEYEWYVIAFDSTGKGRKSEVNDFYYSTTVTQVDLYVKEIVDPAISPSGLTSVPQAIIYFETLSGGYVNVYPITTDDNGHFYNPYPYGDYKVIIRKEGFIPATYYLTVSSTSINMDLIITRCAYTIRGFVYDDMSPSNPVSGANVVATDPYLGQGVTSSATTLSDGSFVLYVNSTGIWDIDVSKSGYSPEKVTITVIDEENVFSYNIILTKNKNFLTGLVTNENSQGIYGVLVKATEQGNTSNVYSDTTNSSGNYSMELPDGTWIVSVEKAGFVPPSPVTVSLSGGETKERNFVMQTQANQISGDIFCNGAPLKDVLVRAIPLSGPYYETYTDIFGHYDLSVGTGDFTVKAIKSGYTSDGDKNVSFSGGGETKTGINFVMTENGSYVKGKVTIDLAGNTPLSGALVTNGIDYVYTNTSGAYTLSMLSATYTISASKSGYSSDGDKVVTIGPGETIENINFVLSPDAATIIGDCKTTSGVAIADALVYIYETATSLTRTTYSNSSGIFSISVPYGTHDIFAAKEGFLNSNYIRLTLTPGETSSDNHLIFIQDIGYISGTVKDENSNNISNAEIVVYNSSGTTSTTYTDLNGNYLIYIKTGGYEIFARKTGYIDSLHKTGSVSTSDTISNPKVEFLTISSSAKTIAGFVYDINGYSLNGALVKVFDSSDPNHITLTSATTNGSGYYTLNIPATVTNFDIVASKYGYTSQAKTNQTSLTQNFNLNINYGTLQIDISTSDSGNVNAIVSANGNTKTTGNNPSPLLDFTMPLFAGVYTITITQSGYYDLQLTNININPGQITDAGSVTLQKISTLYSVSGNVSDGVTGILNATVEIRTNPGNALVNQTFTDSSGNYTLLDIPDGNYNLYAFKTGYDISSPQNITVSGSNVSGINFILTQNNASIYIFVSDSSTLQPLNNVNISLIGTGTNTGYFGSGITNITGGVTITSRHAGTYNIFLTKSGYNDFNSSVTLTNGNTLNVSYTMTLNSSLIGILTGQIIDDNSNPLNNIQVEVYDQLFPDYVSLTLVSNSSGYYGTTLPAGDYRLKPVTTNYISIPGQAFISLAAGITQTVNFTFNPIIGGGIIIDEPPVIIYNTNIGGPYRFTAVLKDANGQIVNTTINWRVEPQNAGAMSSNGIYTPTTDYLGEVDIIAEALNYKSTKRVSVWQKMTSLYPYVKVRDYEGFSLEIPDSSSSPSNAIDRITLLKYDINRVRAISKDKKASGKIYKLTEDFLFTKSVLLTLPLPANIDKNSAQIGLWNENSLKWEGIGGQKGNSDISVNVMHFSEYAVISDLKTLGIDYVNLTPNPFSPYHTGLNIQYNLNSLEGAGVEVSIKIYNMAGKLVRTLINKEIRPVGYTNIEKWDGKNDNGDWCANGRYILQIEIKDTSGKKQFLYPVVLIK